MTRILVAHTGPDVCMASDRLLSKREASRPWEPYDIDSNKCALCLGNDCLFVLGYTGTAVVDGKWTDEWLAEHICDKKLLDDCDRDSPPTIRVQTPELASLYLRDIVDRLLQGMKAAEMAGAFRAVRSFEVVLAGWRLTSKRPGFAVLMSRQRDGTFTAEWERAEKWPRRGSLFMYALPTLSSDSLEWLNRRIGYATSLEDIEDALLGGIHRESDADTTVGADCLLLSVTLSGLAVRVRFVPRRQPRRRPLPGHTEALPIAFMPWIIKPGLVQYPGVAAGGPGFTSPPLDMSVETPPLPPELHGLSYWGSHVRNAPP